MIDRAVLRELAAMLFERAESKNELSRDDSAILAAEEEAEELSKKSARRWYEALLLRRNSF